MKSVYKILDSHSVAIEIGIIISWTDKKPSSTSSTQKIVEEKKVTILRWLWWKIFCGLVDP